jgi:hypothetical protein
MGKGPCADRAGTKLAKFSGVGERQLRRYLVELEKAGWISRRRVLPRPRPGSALPLLIASNRIFGCLRKRKAPRGRRRHDPLSAVWDSEVVPLLKSVPGLRPVAIFDGLRLSSRIRRRFLILIDARF